jgi:hypothetical protein
MGEMIKSNSAVFCHFGSRPRRGVFSTYIVRSRLFNIYDDLSNLASVLFYGHSEKGEMKTYKQKEKNHESPD